MTRPLLGLLAAVLCAASGACTPSEPPPSSAKVDAVRSRALTVASREWRAYLADPEVSHSSPLAQINTENVSDLEVAWRYDSRDAWPDGSSQIQFNPLIIKGVLYGVSPTLRLFALDAATGEELWSFRPEIAVEIWTTSRGAVYWEEGAEERLFLGAGPFLYALDPRTGRPVEEFGESGRVDLREGLGRDISDDMMGVVATSPPALFDDMLIVGGRVNETFGAAPGHVRGYDVRTGEQRWIFHTIPAPGEFGHDTWPADAWQNSGGANAWAGMSVDTERGLVFVPTGSATFDFHGADRPGDNLFANTLLALDARSGERVWHFQTIRHDLWDRDLPAPPNLVEIERAGEKIPAVAQVTKTGDTFVFHRETGEPLFPIREEPVGEGAVSGEAPARTQPLPVRPPPFTRQEFTRATVTDRTPKAEREILERLEPMRFGSLYLPPSVEGTIEYPGADGGAEWGGAAWDSSTGLLYVNANQVPYILQLIELEEGTNLLMSPAGGYVFACAGCHGMDMKGDGSSVPSLIDIGDRLSFLDIYAVVRDGRGRMPGMGSYAPWWQIAALTWFVYFADQDDIPSQWVAPSEGPVEFVNAGYQKLLDSDRLPGSKPPWGTLNAIDLNAGALRWQVPLGDYPEAIALGQTGLGAENYGGPVVTDGGLLFIGATPDEKFRAFDKATGQVLWETDLPAAGFATPSTYEADGRQFVVIAAGGGKLTRPSGSQYVAYALPLPMERSADDSNPLGSSLSVP